MTSTLVTDADPILDDPEIETIEDDGRLVFDPQSSYTASELEAHADQLLKDDSNRELCRKCRADDPSSLPYGEETGNVESKPQYEKDEPILDEDGDQLYMDFPELMCAKGHRWFKGEGQRRDIRGPNPILFESHLYNRKRREIYVETGTPDPAFTLDRFGKPTTGLYNRSHPAGRKINTEAQRRRNGAPLALDTPLLTTNGWRTIGSVQIGDLVYDRQKQRVPIIGFSPVYRDHSCYRIEFNDGSSLIADGDHLWTNADGDEITTKEILVIGHMQLPESAIAHFSMIASIHPVPPVPVRCLMLDNRDHLFLIGRHLHLTHNSYYR